MTVVERLVDHPLAPIPPGARCGVVTAADGVRLRWATFAPLAPTRGTVLILQGRAEFIERWFETVRDLQVRGFAVVTFDWRGQGGSQRLAGDPTKGHVRSFRHYARDLDAILAAVMPELPRPWFLLGHSTGALVAMAEQARLAGVFARAVFTAPFLGLGDHGFAESLARPVVRLMRALALGRLRVPGGDPAPISTTPQGLVRLTSDPTRHARNRALALDRPELTIGSPTVGWLAAAFDAMDRVMRPEALAGWRLPTLVFVAGAEVVVANRPIETFVVETRTTDMLVVPGARHELLQERDRFREQVWAAFDAFVPGSLTPPAAAKPPAAAATPPAADIEPHRSHEPAHPEETAAVVALAATTAAIAAAATPPSATDEPSAAVGEPIEHDLMQPRIAGGDDSPALGGVAAGPGGDDATRSLDDRDQRDDVVGLQPGLDHHVDEATGQHAVGVAVDAVAEELHR